MSERLLPSDVEAVERMIKSETPAGRVILDLCAEIRACWAELELLRPIAIAAAEQIAARPQLETPLLEAVEAWQKSNRNSA